ncbi:30S ribosomal protein S18 [Nitrospira japonica]|uniref:30S ribosomal protein S18 n=1 Tax=Nitrospira japonica TaxID=1325564 RepID=UPI0009B9721D|nr:30S ribosomal protein S18 [Nitrospira japonica]
MLPPQRQRVLDESAPIDWTNAEYLRPFLSDQGRILPRRMTGNTPKRQRLIARAIKRARHMALLPFAGAS